MKNISLKSFFGKFTRNISWLFFIGFLALVLLEAFKVNTSVQFIFQSNQEAPRPTPDKSVRINFEGYDYVINRISEGERFVPSGGLVKDPFNSGAPINQPNISPQPQSGPSNELLQSP